jgi:alcohol dehydrogenase class IV
MAGEAAFEFATANRIVFGAGKLTEAVPAVKALGRRALVVTGKSVERAQPLLDLLSDIECVTHAILGEPKIADVQSGVNAAAGCEVVIAMGGGSAIDAGKAIAALCSNPGNPLDYLEVIGKGQPLVNAPLPFIAIPTTSRHRGRGHAQCRARFAETQGQSKPAPSLDAATTGHC